MREYRAHTAEHANVALEVHQLVVHPLAKRALLHVQALELGNLALHPSLGLFHGREPRRLLVGLELGDRLRHLALGLRFQLGHRHEGVIALRLKRLEGRGMRLLHGLGGRLRLRTLGRERIAVLRLRPAERLCELGLGSGLGRDEGLGGLAARSAQLRRLGRLQLGRGGVELRTASLHGLELGPEPGQARSSPLELRPRRVALGLVRRDGLLHRGHAALQVVLERRELVAPEGLRLGRSSRGRQLAFQLGDASELGGHAGLGGGLGLALARDGRRQAGHPRLGLGKGGPGRLGAIVRIVDALLQLGRPALRAAGRGGLAALEVGRRGLGALALLGQLHLEGSHLRAEGRGRGIAGRGIDGRGVAGRRAHQKAELAALALLLGLQRLHLALRLGELLADPVALAHERGVVVGQMVQRIVLLLLQALEKALHVVALLVLELDVVLERALLLLQGLDGLAELARLGQGSDLLAQSAAHVVLPLGGPGGIGLVAAGRRTALALGVVLAGALGRGVARGLAAGGPR
mmetsp:Transcript_13946/g.44668  ORF Transcript_13946/g.44668 Transcript_13946/m.44668 type:complete len:521 (+) Transcript_13946:1284-2846(+)